MTKPAAGWMPPAQYGYQGPLLELNVPSSAFSPQYTMLPCRPVVEVHHRVVVVFRPQPLSRSVGSAPELYGFG